jgi:hypothetical protein
MPEQEEPLALLVTALSFYLAPGYGESWLSSCRRVSLYSRV